MEDDIEEYWLDTDQSIRVCFRYFHKFSKICTINDNMTIKCRAGLPLLLHVKKGDTIINFHIAPKDEDAD